GTTAPRARRAVSRRPRVVGPTPRGTSPPASLPRVDRMTARRIALALLVPLLVLAGCSGDDGGDGEGATEPTDGGDGDAETAARALFERDLDAAFLGQGTYSAPVLVLPAADGLPWTLGGWQLDP